MIGQHINQPNSAEGEGEALITDNLRQFFATCENNPEAEISSRINTLVEKTWFPSDDAQLKSYTVKLYYQTLEKILVQEASRVTRPNFNTLLHHEKFHRSLFAACLEIVLCTYATQKFPELEFPHFIRQLGITPFDFSKIIEAVIRAQPNLSRSVIKHLVTIEERILESLAWEEESPLWASLRQEDVRSTMLQRLQTTGTPNKITRSACEVFSSPNRADAQQQRRPNTMLPVEIFLRKVAHLAYLRLHKLCNDMQSSDSGLMLADKLIKQMEYIFLYIATQTELLLNRHMDQIIMCVFYAICRVNKPKTSSAKDVTFKGIIEKYQLQPQAKPSVYRNVKLGPEEGEDDIIKFYNKVFLPAVQQIILQFAPNSDEAVSNDESNQSVTREVLSPAPDSKFFARTSQRSPIKINNLVVSPMKAPRTPLLLGKSHQYSAKISYQFGMSPQKSLDDINRTVNNLASPKALSGKDGPRKKLNFDDIVPPSGDFTQPQLDSVSSTISTRKRKLEFDDVDNSTTKRPKPE